MIRAELFINKAGTLCGFCIKGHSGFAESGSDIICASVSSSAYMAANTITEILKADADIQVRDGYLSLNLSDKDMARCQDILSGFKLHLCSLEEQYPKFLTVYYLEV